MGQAILAIGAAARDEMAALSPMWVNVLEGRSSAKGGPHAPETPIRSAGFLPACCTSDMSQPRVVFFFPATARPGCSARRKTRCVRRRNACAHERWKSQVADVPRLGTDHTCCPRRKMTRSFRLCFACTCVHFTRRFVLSCPTQIVIRGAAPGAPPPASAGAKRASVVVEMEAPSPALADAWHSALQGCVLLRHPEPVDRRPPAAAATALQGRCSDESWGDVSAARAARLQDEASAQAAKCWALVEEVDPRPVRALASACRPGRA